MSVCAWIYTYTSVCIYVYIYNVHTCIIIYMYGRVMQLSYVIILHYSDMITLQQCNYIISMHRQII